MYVLMHLGEIKEIKDKIVKNQKYVVLSPEAFVNREPWIVVSDRDT